MLQTGDWEKKLLEYAKLYQKPSKTIGLKIGALAQWALAPASVYLLKVS